MTKYKVLKDNSRYGEVEVAGEHGEHLILTDRKRVYSDDYDSIGVWWVDCLQEVGKIPERIYQLSYMPDGYSLITAYVDEAAVEKLFRENIKAIIRKDAHQIRAAIVKILDECKVNESKEAEVLCRV